uniref:G_PROTEIN_RECEP_F1_2 domain-containing protein n=1 Tax=Steinernema glaseri TaxID=37863 RepID=A0A1I7ZIA7_9BILA
MDQWVLGFKIALWFEIVAYVISLPLEIYLIACLRKSSLLHGNLKIMLINLCVAMVVFALSHVGMHVDSELQALGLGVDNVACRPSAAVLRIFFDGASNMTGVAMMLISLERAVASFRPQSYEQKKTTTRVAFALFFMWSASFCVAVATWFYFHVRVDSCEPSYAPPSISFLYVNSMAMVILAGVALFGVASSACLLLSLLCLNLRRHRRCDIGRLNLRYQYSENISTIRFLMPITATYAALLLICIFFLVLFHLERHSASPHTVKLLFYEKSANRIYAKNIAAGLTYERIDRDGDVAIRDSDLGFRISDRPKYPDFGFRIPDFGFRMIRTSLVATIKRYITLIVDTAGVTKGCPYYEERSLKETTELTEAYQTINTENSKHGKHVSQQGEKQYPTSNADYSLDGRGNKILSVFISTFADFVNQKNNCVRLTVFCNILNSKGKRVRSA